MCLENNQLRKDPFPSQSLTVVGHDGGTKDAAPALPQATSTQEGVGGSPCNMSHKSLSHRSFPLPSHALAAPPKLLPNTHTHT